MVLDSRVTTPPGQSVEDAPLGSPGYVTDGVVRYINLEDVTLAEALTALLRMLDLTFAPDDGFIWISSPELIDAPALPAEAVRPETVPSAKAKQRQAANDAVTPLSPAAQPHAGGFPFQVLRIVDVQGRPRVQVQLRTMKRWFDVGDMFERYEVEAIDLNKGTATFRSTPTGMRATFDVKQGSYWLIVSDPGAGDATPSPEAVDATAPPALVAPTTRSDVGAAPFDVLGIREVADGPRVQV